MCIVADRRHGADLEQELDEGVDKMMAYISALQAEIKDRTSLIEMLDLSDAFYENQRGEAKIVCNAYRNFSKRVENLKKKLDELTNDLPSPVPSPDINAPSPSPESDIDLPDDNLAD
ncbi:Regulation of nuclear pre-mRNA domain-containing protein 2 [Homalodisca vitripennis]|nr:Regulation of nuclear pre-mRNA domain-containing protein 2 [Homalodisca vitripennis]